MLVGHAEPLAPVSVLLELYPACFKLGDEIIAYAAFWVIEELLAGWMVGHSVLGNSKRSPQKRQATALLLTCQTARVPFPPMDQKGALKGTNLSHGFRVLKGFRGFQGG